MLMPLDVVDCGRSGVNAYIEAVTPAQFRPCLSR